MAPPSTQPPYFIRDIDVGRAVVVEEVAVIPWSFLIFKHKRLLLWTTSTCQTCTAESRIL